MREAKELEIRKPDNRGASLLIVLAAFVLLLTVATNILMLVSSGNRTAVREYETEQTRLYIATIYEILNGKMVRGEWKEAFVPGESVEIEVTGFHDGNGTDIPVTITVLLNGNLADVSYLMESQGKQYVIMAQYQYGEGNGTVTITLKNCREIVQI